MLQLLVVDEMDDRRAGTVDALCELPGIEVSANASTLQRALALLEYLQPDVVVASSDMSGASIVTLIDTVRRRGTVDVIVVVTNRVLLPGMTEYWKDLGARAVVDTMPELVAQLQRLTQLQVRRRDPRLQHVARLSNALVGAGAAGDVAQSSAEPQLDRRPRTSAPIVSVGDVLRDVLPRLARLVHDEIEIVLEVAPDVPRVRCAANDLERLALHLVHDATTAVPLGGKIWLIVEREGQRHVRIEALDSSGTSRTPGSNVDSARIIVDRYSGALRVVDLGNATSLQAVLPALVDAAN
jgi:CheY-like chemotaxis protein